MKKTLPIVLSVATLALLSVLTFNLSESQKALTLEKEENTNLSTRLADKEKELSRYTSIDKSILLSACSTKAANDYSDYIRKNSVTTVSGDVTTFYPKSPHVIDTATKNRADAVKSCEVSFKN